MKKPISTTKPALAALKKARQARMKAAIRFGRMAVKLGIPELGLNDRELLPLFKEMAERFRANTDKQKES